MEYFLFVCLQSYNSTSISAILQLTVTDPHLFILLHVGKLLPQMKCTRRY